MKRKNMNPKLRCRYSKTIFTRPQERGVALAIALILLGLLMTFTALSATIVTSDARMADAQYRHLRTFNAGMASLEVMTDKFSKLYAGNKYPTQEQIAKVAAAKPIIKEGSTDLYKFDQTIVESTVMRNIIVKDPPFNDLMGSERNFRLQTVTTENSTNTQIRFIRDVSNYNLPIFQFAAFGFDNLDISPGPVMYIGGRTHSNRSIFFTRTNANTSFGPAQFYGPITAAGEMCRNIYPSGTLGDNATSQEIYIGGARNFINPSIKVGEGPDDPAKATNYDYGLADDPTVPGSGTKVGGVGPKGYVTPGSPKLTLPSEDIGFQAVEILRRARLADQPEMQNVRLFNGKYIRGTTIRVLLDDDIDEFPAAIAGEPKAYDLAQLADPNDPVFNNFWRLASNVYGFDPSRGNDNPDSAAGTFQAGTGTLIPATRVLPPQTNLVNAQPEYQTKVDGSVDINLRKHTYIKIELLNYDSPPAEPTRIDITPQILNLGITTGPIPVPTTSLTNASLINAGTVRSTSTYAGAYSLNDGNSISRLTNTATDAPENFMPFLNNSTVAANIGKYSGGFGIFPTQNIRIFDNTKPPTDPTIPINTNISYVYEPNSILRLQRTSFPYSPTNNLDMTCADPPLTSDNGATALNTGSGRLADSYPARMKSLIAKPYFRFTDDFLNSTYVKGDPDGSGGFKMKNPLDVVAGLPGGANAYRYIFNGNSGTGDKTGERFIRDALIQAPTITSISPTGVVSYGGTPTSGNLPSSNSLDLTILGQPVNYNLDKIFKSAGSSTGVWEPRQQQIANYLRQYVFKAGIPGFYSLALGSGMTGLDPTQNGVVGDNFVDLDLNRNGIADLQELTPFPNTTDQTKLQNYLFSPKKLLPGDFNNLTTAGAAILIDNLQSAEMGTPGKPSDPKLTGSPVNGVPEIPKENLVFDWNGDGVIDPPKRPFQNTGTLGANAIGYSVESNISSLIPSSLRVVHDLSVTPTSQASALVDATTSVPVEIRFIEDPPTTGSTTLAATPPGGECNLTGQPAPNIPASGGYFVDGLNSFVIPIPFNSLPGQITVQSGPHAGKKINLREGARVIFQHPLATRFGGTSTALEAQLGRRLGLTDAHYAFPGHVYMDFTPDGTNPDAKPIDDKLISKLRVEMDRAFPINIYDQREGRHISRRYGFQNIPTAADYYTNDIGGGPQKVSSSEWPTWPNILSTTLPATTNILFQMASTLPMPSPIALERRGVINLVELDVGNLKKLFRGDFNSYLATFTTASSSGEQFTSGQPRSAPKGDSAVVWGGNGVIDISNNGFALYISDRRGDDNNDGMYEFNDVFGENNALDALDDTVNTLIAGPQFGKPGDGVLRRDVDVETQPTATPTLTNPARTGESPHGSMPVNDGFEYFCGNINTTTQRSDAQGNRLPGYQSLLPGTTSTTGTFDKMSGTGVSTAEGAVNWRMVDSAKTGRIRAFRHAVRLVNAIDIPRWYLDVDGPVSRHFTGFTLASEGPVYIHGNLNSIGVRVATSDALDPESGIAAGGPTQTRSFLQTGNRFNGRTPGDWESDSTSPDRIMHGPMGILADAVNIHSRNWQDARMFISPYAVTLRPQDVLRRIPIETTVKAAWFTGQPKAGTQTTSQNTVNTNNDWTGALLAGTSPNSQGGLHNFPRFCENWLNLRFNYNGSFVWDFYSHQGNGPWLFNGPPPADVEDKGNYIAPTRNWNFDVAFRRFGGLPPVTPDVTFYKIRGFREVFLEDNPH